jgi:hypothetical protein
MSDATYTREMQADDLQAIAIAQLSLSAMVVGQPRIDRAYKMDVYARISGYNQGLHVRQIARMFWKLSTAHQIDGFDCIAFERLLDEQRKLVKSKLIMRKRKLKTCAKMNEHIQVCTCANLARAQANAKEAE